MKKAILLLILITLISGYLKAQTKPDTTKAKYNKVIVLQPADYQTLVGLASSYRNLTTYSPLLKPEEKLQEQAGVDQFLYQLPQRAKLDSVKVKK